MSRQSELLATDTKGSTNRFQQNKTKQTFTSPYKQQQQQ
jgi:hypothetical protein